ncbi:MAG: hypothetical protein HC840_16190 [Leptolyngbyaceae cyanobacterium RM2_2_4]|nr:hypothetical protein [Leptolyngbyaceae cyanobacterium SM1_4_3]NJN89892.1 hypothetical protein [Leptolyngbyaceae cyanobacterium SL_5_14]NJO50724.1 hypothetical protein [Leptolyngbyaceae cyanobacterium RM2_2_4]NJO66572.1 hypothetical protein [Leptolyngbyaceae cyanobacterium RM1_405_57]
MSDTLNKLGSSDSAWIEEQIGKVRDELTEGESEIASLKSGYKQLIRQYFDERKPFPSSGKNFQSDLKQYRELIAHSVVLDDLSFLKYWGVDYPRSHDFKVLTNSVNDYLIAFDRICQDQNYRERHNIPDGVVVYYKTLIEWLSV